MKIWRILIITLIGVLSLLPIVMAGWECTPLGGTIPNGTRAGERCFKGCCIICVGSYLFECRPNPICTCGPSVNNDFQPPTITILTPTEGTTYTTRDINLSFSLDEESEFVMRRLDDDRSPSIFCRDCIRGSFVYKRLSDGPHSFGVIATDHFGNTAEKNVSFFIDATPPVIKDVLPENNTYVTSTAFMVQYDEQTNPMVQLHYGVQPEENVISFSNCPRGLKQTCSRQIDLTSYNGKTVQFYFSISDGFNTVQSKRMVVLVDTTDPQIQLISPTQDFYADKRIPVQIQILNEMVSTIELTDFFGVKPPKPKKICSKNCMNITKTYSFNDGLHTLSIRATDFADNSAEYLTQFTVDTKEPKIKKTHPERGTFTSGNFSIEYEELNPTEVTLHYRSIGQPTYTELKKTDCPAGKSSTCTFQVNLASFNNQQIEYYFSIKDHFFETVEKIPSKVSVDTSPPVMTVSAAVNGKSVTFIVSVSEKVDITYKDVMDILSTTKPLCNNCNAFNNAKPFNQGGHTVVFTATDQAGNKDTELVSFVVP